MRFQSHGIVKDGKLELVNKDWFNDGLKKFNGEVLITLEYDKASRSTQQNRYLWGAVYKLISGHTGYSVEEVHELCKFRFNQKHLDFGGEKIDFGGSTTEMSTGEFTGYIEAIRIWAAEYLEVNIPDPAL